MNYDIIPADGARKRHWMEDPPRPVNGSYNDQWHQVLNHNFLTNLLHGNAPDDNGRIVPADFNWYFKNSIKTVATYFAARMDTVPVADGDTLRLASFTPHDVYVGKATLALIAGETGAGSITMGDLYVYPNAASKPDYERFIDLFEHFQRTLKWACMPFVGLRTDIAKDPSISRPSAADLDKHLDGVPNSSGGYTQTPIGNKNYLGVLNLKESVNADRAALIFAVEKRFIDPLSPVQRNEGMTFANQDVKTAVMQGMVGTKGGGNSYKCVSGSCVKADPQDYCTTSSC
ncbi:MAG: hypothetical protein RLZZ303_1558 [Candidatus Hydrogenedentota bacterium]|jgi:hypothetical protein